MLARRVRGLVGLALASSAVALLAPGAAHAASLVFVKDGNVWIAGADGSGARPVTAQANNWAWPSEADDGTILAAGGAQRINADGSDSDGSTELYRMDQQGRIISGPVTTPGSMSTPACPTFAPQVVRVSPDGASVAYSTFFCDSLHTFWGPSNAGFGAAHESLADYGWPSWIDNGRFLITHFGPTLTAGQAEWGVFDTGTQAGSGWHAGEDYLSGYEAVVSRSGTRVAVIQDDGADNLGQVVNAKISIYTASGIEAPDTAPHCTIALDASTFQHAGNASPSLSPDGGTVVWAQDDGIHAATTDCTNARLLIPGGAFPFFGTAAASAAATAAPAAPGPAGAQPGAPVAGGAPKAPAPVRTKASIRLRAHRIVAHRRVKFSVHLKRAKGVRILRYRWSFGDHHRATTRSGHATHVYRRPGRYTIRLSVKDSKGKTATTKLRITVRRR
jgi:hypothetical protein